MTGKKVSIQGSWFILAAAILWGTTGTTQGLAPENATPLSIGAVRLAVGGLALLAFAIIQGGASHLQRDWKHPMVLISALFVAAYQLCFF